MDLLVPSERRARSAPLKVALAAVMVTGLVLAASPAEAARRLPSNWSSYPCGGKTTASPPPVVAETIHAAALEFGANEAKMTAIARGESGYDPASWSYRYHGGGLFGFLTHWWPGVVRAFNRANPSDRISTPRSGRDSARAAAFILTGHMGKRTQKNAWRCRRHG